MVLTGDIHTALAGDLRDNEGRGFGAELVCSSITSPGLDEVLPSRDAGGVAQGFIERNPDLVYVDGAKRGWLRLDLTQRRIKAQWHVVSTVHDKAHNRIAGPSFLVAHRDRQKDGSILKRSV